MSLILSHTDLMYIINVTFPRLTDAKIKYLFQPEIGWLRWGLQLWLPRPPIRPKNRFFHVSSIWLFDFETKPEIQQ